MSNLSPYTPPNSESDDALHLRPTTGNRIWIGFLVAPPVVPLLIAAAILLSGPILIDPSDTGTPIGIVLLPMAFSTVGVAISYFLTLLLGMPIATWLNRRDRLNGYSIHASALVISILLGVFLIGSIVIAQGIAGTQDARPLELLTSTAMACLLFIVLIIPTATIFWLVSCKFGARRSAQEIEKEQ